MFNLIYPVGAQAPIIQDHKSKSSGRAAEMLPIVDECGVVVGQASRKYCHSGHKPLHPVVHLHIINRESQIYIQKRSLTKDLYPGRWDTAVGGHICYGESILEALYREAGEELGFFEYNPIYLFSYVFESEFERELINVFAAVGNFDLHPDLEEVEDGRYWSMAEIDESIGKSIFTPNFESEYDLVRKPLEALL